MKRRDLTGQKFGKLTALKLDLKANKRSGWLCQCECGNQAVVSLANLVSGTKSCGCLWFQSITTHGNSSSAEYKCWAKMKQRCKNPKQIGFIRYGGRGIKVCDRWLNSFENFFADMGPKPSPQHSIDRINNNGNYEPSNCRWVTKAQQDSNKSTNVFLTVDGRTQHLAAWTRETGIPGSLIKQRMDYGWPAEKCVMLNREKRKGKAYE